MGRWLRAACCVLVAWSAAAAPGDGRPAPARVYAGLKASSLKVRLKAVKLLGSSGDPAAPAALVPLLAEKDPVMRATVCEALAGLRARAQAAAVKPLLDDPDALVAQRAREAMAQLVVTVETHDGGDLGDSGLKGLGVILKKGTDDALAARAHVALAPVPADGRGFAVDLAVQSLTLGQDGGKWALQAVVTATVIEQPMHALRFSTRITAGLAVDNEPSGAAKQALAEDALASAAPALADELATWFARLK